MSATDDLPTNQDSNVLKTSNNDGEVTGFRVHSFQYTTLGKIILHRLFNNRDLKLLITSRGNTTGTGKTQLAIVLAKTLVPFIEEIYNRQYSWDALDNSFIDVYDYLNKYKNADPGDILITDELEYLADKRRSMSHDNVHFSQAWQMLRYKNVVTLGTAPSQANLDVRVTENIDIWINIIYPGYANVYYVTMDDFTGEIEYKRLKQFGFKESVRWKPIDNDPDYQKLSEKKEEVGIPGISDNEDERFDEEDLEQRQKKTEKELTEEFTVRLLRMNECGMVDLTQEEIAEAANRSQQYVSKVKRTANV